MSTLSPEQFKAKVERGKLRPTESDFIGKPGYKRIYRDPKDESKGYDWRYRFTPNDGHGKPTREYQEVGEMLKPYTRAETEWQLSQPQPATAVLRDGNGGLRYVDPALADKSAREHGWDHVWRAGGCRVERGIDGELWRHWPNGDMEPTGRWCLTTPQSWAAVPENGNPDGTMR